MRKFPLAGASLLATLSLTSPASALAPGVHVDPNSPAAKEYSIPLGQARSGGHGGSSSEGNLFGSGIRRVANASSSGNGAGAGASRSATGGAGAGRGVGGTFGASRSVSSGSPSVPDPSSLAAIREFRGNGNGTGIGWMFGVAALVLVLGGTGGGLIARRGRRANARTSTS
jgi:hypothetical protein